MESLTGYSNYNILYMDYIFDNIDNNIINNIKEQIDNKNVLVVGMGGGNDVLMAYMIANYLGNTENIMYANCSTIREGNKYISKNEVMDNTITEINNILYKFKDFDNLSFKASNIMIKEEDKTYKTLLTEQLVYEITGVNPYIIMLNNIPYNKFEDIDQSDIYNYTYSTLKIITTVLNYLKIDIVIGIDTGGDSISGGTDFIHDVISSRDQQVLNAFRICYSKNIINKFYHIVLAPCCDGETSSEDMINAILNKNTEWPTIYHSIPVNNKNFIGAFSLNDLINNPYILHIIDTYTGESRTPSYINYALQYQKNNNYVKEINNENIIQDNKILIKRHGNIQLIFYEWFTIGILFDYNKEYKSNDNENQIIEEILNK